MNRGRLLLIGLAAGFISGFLGIGGGSVIVPGLVIWTGLSQHESQGISLFVLIPTVTIGFLTYSFNGYVALYPFLLLAAGGALGAVIGSRLAFAIPPHRLRVIFGMYLIGIAVYNALSITC